MAYEAAHRLFDAHTEYVPARERKVAITGGTTGIGRAFAFSLAAEGAKVFIPGVEEHPLGCVTSEKAAVSLMRVETRLNYP